MNKLEKQQYIENLDTMSKDYTALFVASFSNMSVKDMINFRTEIRNNEGVAKVSKNNIVKIFINKDEQKKMMSEYLSQQKILIFTNNPVGTAKVCKKYEKDLKKLSAEVAFF
jgi:ribosomal protein L10